MDRSDDSQLPQLPFASALLVTRNEEKFVEKALESLLRQTYPAARYEIIVVDGRSNDATVDLAKKLIQTFQTENVETPEVTFLDNPKKILASGWNIGIKAAKGDYVVRIDAHAEVAPDFLQKSVETILARDAICVGGKLTTKTLEQRGKIVGDVLSSSFGVGNSSFRVSDAPGYADTAVYGLYKKSVFEKLGYFDEDLVRNQDFELHSRFRRAGERFYFNPEIQSVYYARSSVAKMTKQGFQNGKWNFVTLRKNGTRLALRHAAPLAFVLFLCCATLGGLAFRPLWFVEFGALALYCLLGTAAALQKTRNVFQVAKMLGLFFTLHAAYGVGSLVGIFVKIKKSPSEP